MDIQRKDKLEKDYGFKSKDKLITKFEKDLTKR